MHDVKIGQRYGYSGIGKWLQGPECKQIIRSKTNEAALLYAAFAAKRTGTLARSAKVRMNLVDGRWVGSVEVGADYAASHEFGHEAREFGHDQGGVQRDGFDELRETLRYLED